MRGPLGAPFNQNRVTLIRYLGPSDLTSRIAAAEFERRVSVWDLCTGECLSKFDTILDGGGRRLALSPDGSRCFAGAYRMYGVGCYRTDTGRLVWQRKDLRKVQYLAVSGDGERLFCGLEVGPCAVLDTTTGRDIQRWRGVRRVLESRLQPWLLLEKSVGPLELIDFTGNTRVRLDRETFAVLSAAFGPDRLCLSEAGGSVRAVSLMGGSELWRYNPPPGTHVLGLGYVETNDWFVGVEWSFERGGPKQLLVWEQPDATVRVVAPIGEVAAFAFCSRREKLVLSDGRVLDVASGAEIKRLAFGAHSGGA